MNSVLLRKRMKLNSEWARAQRRNNRKEGKALNVSNVENAAEARAGSSSTMFVREFAFERAAAPPSAQGEERSVEISFSSEDPVRRYDWW